MEGYGNENPGAFQPTRPLRGATTEKDNKGSSVSISTHAPLAGRDAKIWNNGKKDGHFNPRAPCGARRRKQVFDGISKNFNPRAPCGARLAGIKIKGKDE